MICVLPLFPPLLLKQYGSAFKERGNVYTTSLCQWHAHAAMLIEHNLLKCSLNHDKSSLSLYLGTPLAAVMASSHYFTYPPPRTQPYQ